jgi:ferredoxin-NADP reductase
MLKFIDRFLNSITMYRLMLYGLLIEFGYVFLLAIFGKIAVSPFRMVIALAVLLVSSFGANWIFGRMTRAAVNAESVFVTALLLFFIFDPNTANLMHVGFLVLGAVIAQVSKYVLAVGRRHVLNPVAASAVILGVFGIPLVTWWIATPLMLPMVLVFGLMVVRKIRRFEEVGAFMAAVIITALFQGISVQSLFTSWPIVFFATMMLTEPRTAPAMKRDQIIFGAGVGVLFMSMFSVGPIFMTPELSLVIGNIFAFFVSSKQVVRLTFKEKSKETEQVYDYVFIPDHRLNFTAGQYAEWTLPLHKSDSRGNRRYFTIASAPSDTEIHLGVRVEQKYSSAFKQQLLEMKPGDEIFVSHLAGEFVLPKKTQQKFVWIAGGIGVTPFRSMMREIAARNETCDAHLFYCANSETDFAYQKELEQLSEKIGSKISCVVAKPTSVWTGKSGYITKEVIESEVPDYASRLFYFSGPPAMVENYVHLVRSMGVPKKQIRTDYFPGF